MLRPSRVTRPALGLAVAISVGTVIGFGAYSLGSAAGANSSQPSGHPTATAAAETPPMLPTTRDKSGVPAGTSTPTPAAHLTLAEATALAVRFAPGRVVEVDEDQEPTGLRYDLTLLHDDGTATEVRVDSVTAQITSTTVTPDQEGT